MSANNGRTPYPSVDDLVAAARQFEPEKKDLDALMVGLNLGGPPDGGGSGATGTASSGAGLAGLAGGHGGLIAGAVGIAGAIIAVVAAVQLTPTRAPPDNPQLVSVAILSSPAVPSATADVSPPISASAEPSALPAKPRVVTPARPAQDLGAESEILHRARAAMRSDPAQSLAILREHRARFPRGVLAEERDALRVEALARLGKSKEAKKESDRFLKEHPDSVHADRIDSAMSSKGDGGSK